MSISKRNAELAIRLPDPPAMAAFRQSLGEPRLSHRNNSMIGTLLPDAACSEMFSDAPESAMFSIEAAIVANADAARRLEFGTVRYCARQALREIGMPAVPILPDSTELRAGRPAWSAA